MQGRLLKFIQSAQCQCHVDLSLHRGRVVQSVRKSVPYAHQKQTTVATLAHFGWACSSVKSLPSMGKALAGPPEYPTPETHQRKERTLISLLVNHRTGVLKDKC